MYYNNKRLALSIFWVVLGLTLIVLSVTEVLDSSVYAGMGGALTTVGALQTLRIVRSRKDEGYREKVDTEVSDERNRFLREKSWAWTGYIVVMAEALGSVAAMILGQRSIQMMLSYSVCLLLVVYWIVYIVLSKKY